MIVYNNRRWSQHVEGFMYGFCSLPFCDQNCYSPCQFLTLIVTSKLEIDIIYFSIRSVFERLLRREVPESFGPACKYARLG
jgi:hypothetical protein